MQVAQTEELKNLYRRGFEQDSEAYVDYFFRHFATDENTVIYKEEGKIISAGYIVEKSAFLFGRSCTFPYLTALSTLPEYRGKGKIRFVIEKACDILRKRGYAYFGLYPFSYSYYTRFGLQSICYACHSTVIGGQNYTVKGYEEQDFPIVKAIYDSMSKKFENRLLSDDKALKLKLEEYRGDGIECKLLYDQDECFAFAFVDGGRVDLYATTDIEKFARADCLKGCTYFDFFKSDSPYLQGRIIDAKAALFEYFSYLPPKNKVRLRVIDDMIKGNNICVEIERIGDKIVINDCDFAETTYNIDELTKKIFTDFRNFFPDKY